MKIWKILLGIAMLFLIIGAVSAFDVDSLKHLDDCTEFQKGFSNYTIHSDRYFMVCAVQEYSMFENSTEIGLTVTDVGDNIYYFEDGFLGVRGYQELVDIDGETYYVSIDQASQLSPSEEKELLQDMKDFNKLNNLEPLNVDSVT